MTASPESPNEEVARLCAEIERLQERLRHTTQLETLGRLAGGAAHDFNNQLATVLTYADMLKRRLGDPGLAVYADMIAATVERASELVRPLLRLARKGEARRVPVDVQRALAEVAWLLRRSADRRIRIAEQAEETLPAVLGDPTQIQNALLNLGLNACEAMPEGGEARFSARHIHLTEKRSGLPSGEMPPGEYVEVAVSDAGAGMDADTLRRIFDPFFTTKAPEKGTGVGLSAVLEVAVSHCGGVEVESEPGRGTLASLWLPAVHAPAPSSPPQDQAAPLSGAARLLLADDEERLREMSAELLRELGYEVTTCRDGAEAVETYRQAWQRTDLVVLDMLMPRMNGADAFRAMRRINPKVKAVLITGKSTAPGAEALKSEGVVMVQKPCRIAELTRAVAEALRGE